MENNNKDKNNDSINSLPEYKIRTMEGDLDKLKGGISSPIEPLLQKPLNSQPIKVPLAKPVEPRLIEILPVKPIEPPLPKQVKIETPAPQSKPIKTPLPEIEDFIASEKRIDELKKELKTEKIQKLKTENIFETKTKNKTWLIIAIIVLLILMILGFFYWQGSKVQPTTQPPIINNELQVPASLISVEETKILKIENNISLLILLQDEQNIAPIKTFRRIVPTKFSATTNKQEVLSLSDLIKELNISVYPYVLSELKNNYTLVLYGQEENERRFGLIIETKNSDNVKAQSKFWEQTMIENLYNLFLGEQPQIPKNKIFSDGDYNGTQIRFVNFPDPRLSIDYAVTNDLFILSMSKESIRAIIDRIK
jgi:hypothetical protein